MTVWTGIVSFAAGAVPDIEARLARAHAEEHFDGVALVGRGDAVVGQWAFGLADRASGTPHAADEVFPWASITKQVTALLVMQQVERGRLDLDAPVSAYVPRLGSMTLRQLLQHTSGLPNPDDTPAGEGGVPSFYLDPRNRSGARAVEAVCAGPPKRAPGEGWEYNNCDYLALGEVLRGVTGRSFARATRGIGARGAAPVVGYGEGGEADPHYVLATYGAAGGLAGSALDLWRFDRALMDGTLLGDAAREEMWTGDPELGYVALGAWAYAVELPGCAEPVRVVERRGAIGSLQTLNLLAPEEHAAVVLFANDGRLDLGQLWQGQGLAYDLAASAFCQVTAR